MVKAKRIERVAALSKLLADHPYRLFSFSYFCKKFAIAKSTLSEDVSAKYRDWSFTASAR